MLEPGLYDALITNALAVTLDERAVTDALDDAEVPMRYAAHVSNVLARELPELDAQQRHTVVAEVLRALGLGADVPTNPPRLLTGVAEPNSLGALTLPARPDVPLSQHDLLVNARGEPQLASELQREIASSDGVDLIVAFVRWYGVRLLFEELEKVIAAGVPVRLLTTTYTGSTERQALDRLAELGVDIRVSYDTAVTRLHAKAWIFHRRTGFSTAYVGSSNVTRSALLDGREWNLRISKAASPALFDKVRTAFEAQWASADFEPYDPARDAERLDLALGRGRGDNEGDALSGLSLTPWPYQQEILDALATARAVHGSRRNLVVAPTGTGKTVVAALDYRRLRGEHDRDLSLLFVAHREQILKQSRRTFREALGDSSFGELLVGGARPEAGRHVFASIQSLHAHGVANLDPRAFDVLIVDEFHHAEATTYQALLDRLEPDVLLAITATPERADGLDIRRWTDRRTAFDMRLWHALDRQLLAPFQYFGVADHESVDPDRAWARGRYQLDALGEIYTGNHARADLVLRQVHKVIAEPRGMKALAFCATVDHAEFMAARFTDAGLPSVALSGNDPQVRREEAVRKLRTGELCCIFTRDIFNEGIDVPEADTILLLRPTESATVFLQQIGRGLRRHNRKDVCTVLDFVANYRKEFRFDLRLRALTGIPRRDLVDAAEQGFPFLPTGCHLTLERQAREWIIEHLKQSVRTNARALRNELILLSQTRDAEPTLQDFLDETGVDLEDVARLGWASLRRSAFGDLPEGPDEAHLQKGVRRLLHLDDTERIDLLLHTIDDGLHPRDERERRLLWMSMLQLWTGKAAPSSLDEAWERFAGCPALVDELRQSLLVVRDRISHLTDPIPDTGIPLRIGATYARDEILAAFGELHPGRYYAHQAGPWWNEPSSTEVLFITLQKTEKHYSPETMYRDFAISPELFHWESQNSTAIASAAGQRYINQRSNGVRILLAVRDRRHDAWGATKPYVLLGPADYVSHEGERPIALTWRLRTPIPAEVFEQFKVAAA